MQHVTRKLLADYYFKRLRIVGKLELIILPLGRHFRSMLGQQFLDFLDELGLLCAAAARLTPVGKELLEVFHFQFLEIHFRQINLLVYKKDEARTYDAQLLLTATRRDDRRRSDARTHG